MYSPIAFALTKPMFSGPTAKLTCDTRSDEERGVQCGVACSALLYRFGTVFVLKIIDLSVVLVYRVATPKNEVDAIRKIQEWLFPVRREMDVTGFPRFQVKPLTPRLDQDGQIG